LRSKRMKQTINQLAEEVAERLNQKTVKPLSRTIWFNLQRSKKLSQKERLLELVAQKFAKKQGKTRAIVFSVKELVPAEITGVIKKLETRYGTKINLENKVDPTLLGGIKIVTQDEVIDLSWRGKLDDLRKKIEANE